MELLSYNEGFIDFSIVPFINVPEKSICVLVDTVSNSVALKYTGNTFSWLCNNLKYIKAGTHRHNIFVQNSTAVRFVVCETFDKYEGHLLGKYKVGKWIEHFSDRGYNILNKIVVPDLRPVMRYECARNQKGVTAVIYVVDERYNRLKIKEYRNIPEAEEYMKNTDVVTMLKTLLLKV